MVRAHVIISGRVQGVFFRARTQEAARKAGLTGWVKNRPDGKVEAVFEGPDEDVKAVIDWCHAGPSAATVIDVNVTWERFTGGFRDFEIAYG